MKKIILLMLTALMVLLSGCGGSEPESSETLSGTYISVDDNTHYLVFSDTSVTLYESDKQVRSGEYRFQNGALIITYTEFSERYTLDENKETLYEGNSNKANFGEAVFVKGTGNIATVEPSETVSETKSTPLTDEKARAALRVWMDTHPFQNESDIADTYDDAFAFEGSEYYTFYLEITGLGIFDVFVNKETGELFSGGDGEEFTLLPLDTWYEQYGGYAEDSGNASDTGNSSVTVGRKFVNPDPSIPEVMYNGTPVSQLLGMESAEIIKLFGEPGESALLSYEPDREVSYGRDFVPIYKGSEGIKEIIVNHAMANKPFDVDEIISKISIYKYNDSGIAVLFSEETKTVISVMLPPDKCKLNGETLNQAWYDLGTLFMETRGYKTNQRSMTDARDYLVYDSPDTLDVCVAVDAQMNAASVTVTWIDAIPKPAGAPELPRVEYVKDAAQSDLYGTWSWTENTSGGTMTSKLTLYSDGTCAGQFVFAKNGDYASYDVAKSWSFLGYEQILVLYGETQYYDTTFGVWMPKVVEYRLNAIVNGQQLSLEALNSPATRDVVYTKVN